MKPGGAPQGKRPGWMNPLTASMKRFLDGATPSDPFYLSNRTPGQKIRAAAVIALPCLLVASGIGLAMFGFFDSRPADAPPRTALTPEQLAARMLPNLDKNIKIDVNRDVEVDDAHIERGAVTKVVGTARNTTDHAIHNAELVFNLTNAAGSRLGAVSITIPRIEAKSTAAFSSPVEEPQAAFALVREIRTP
jgi:hypothetical protein